MTRYFQIQHLALSIDDQQGLLASADEQMLGMFSRAPATPAEPGGMRMTVHQDRRAPVHNESLPRVWQGSLDSVQFVVYRSGSRRRIEIPGRGVADFDIDRGWAQLCLPSADDATARWFLLLRVVCDGLTRAGHSFLHAACLAVKRGGQWRGVIVSAPSNTGKTTTALGLTNSGWRLLGDDVAYVRPPHLGSAVWGFPRSCHVRPGTFAMLPWLSQLELGPPDKEGVRKLTMANLAPRSWVGGPWLPPALVVVLAPPNARATRVEPIDRAEALSQLGGESINAVPGICDDDAARDFVTVGRLVCSAPACRLSVGPHVADVAAKIEQYLDACEVAPGQRMGRSQSCAA